MLTHESKHVFTDEFKQANPIKCIANIRVEEKISGGSEVFQIYIEYTFVGFVLPFKVISPLRVL